MGSCLRRIATRRPGGAGGAVSREGSDWGAPRPRQAYGRDQRSEQPRIKPGDWMCPACDAHNYASRGECFRCRGPRRASPPPCADLAQ